jgi:hypothetical protein
MLPKRLKTIQFLALCLVRLWIFEESGLAAEVAQVSNVLPKVESTAETDDMQPVKIARINQEESKGGSRVIFGSFYYILKSGSQVASGLGLNGGLIHTISSGFSATGGIRQAYGSEAGLTTFFTAIDAGLVYAFSGGGGGEVREILLDDRPVVRYTRLYTDGLHVSIGLTQYFLNSSISAIPFSGFNMSTYYEFSGLSRLSVDFGVQLEQISNRKQVIYPTSLFVRTAIGN